MSSSKVTKHETSASSHVAAESDVELNLFVEEMIDQMVSTVATDHCSSSRTASTGSLGAVAWLTETRCICAVCCDWRTPDCRQTSSVHNVTLIYFCCCFCLQENRFQLLGNTIMKRMEEMSVRMGDLEQSIANIMEQAGAVAESTTPSSVIATTAGGKDSTSTGGGTIQNNNNNKPKPATTMEI